MKNAALTYRQHAVEGATPVGLVVLLYDGAIAAIDRAITSLEARDVGKKCLHLDLALAIICQLEGSLDFDKGGEVAQTLKKFYAHARSQILLANIRNSKEMLASVVQQLFTVREAWGQVERSAASHPVQSQSSGASTKSGSPSWRLSA